MTSVRDNLSDFPIRFANGGTTTLVELISTDGSPRNGTFYVRSHQFRRHLKKEHAHLFEQHTKKLVLFTLRWYKQCATLHNHSVGCAELMNIAEWIECLKDLGFHDIELNVIGSTIDTDLREWKKSVEANGYRIAEVLQRLNTQIHPQSERYYESSALGADPSYHRAT